MGSLFDELEGSFSALEANMRKYIRPTGDCAEVVQPQHCQCTITPFNFTNVCVPNKFRCTGVSKLQHIVGHNESYNLQ